MFDVFIVFESYFIMGVFELDGEENKDVELLGEFNIFINEEFG